MSQPMEPIGTAIQDPIGWSATLLVNEPGSTAAPLDEGTGLMVNEDPSENERSPQVMIMAWDRREDTSNPLNWTSSKIYTSVVLVSLIAFIT